MFEAQIETVCQEKMMRKNKLEKNKDSDVKKKRKEKDSHQKQGLELSALQHTPSCLILTTLTVKYYYDPQFTLEETTAKKR